jgi:hypothetical protein
MKFVLLHVLFLAIALFIAFALIPLDYLYIDNVPSEEVKKYYQGAFSFKSADAWQTVFTWFLGLTCGRLMIRALSNNTQTTKSIDTD